MKKSFIYFALIILVSGCKNEQEPIPDSNPTCNFEPLILYTTTDDFCNTNSGSVDIGADIEIAEYSIDDGVTFQTSSIFTDLAGGVHRITMKDANDCLSVDSILILSKSGTLAFTTDTVDAGCGTSNGSITINATGGSGTLTYSIDGGTASSNNVFSSLSQGTYLVAVFDTTGCSATNDIVVNAGDISYTTDIDPILTATCATTGCHTSTNSFRRDLTNYTDVKAVASSIKTRLNNGSMPKGTTISASDKQKILCWIDDAAPNN